MYRALTGFAGRISMREGEVREIDSTTAAELMRTGYITPADPDCQEVTDNDGIRNKTRRRKKQTADRL